MSFNFMAAVTICSDFGAQENKICHCFHFPPSICHEVIVYNILMIKINKQHFSTKNILVIIQEKWARLSENGQFLRHIWNITMCSGYGRWSTGLQVKHTEILILGLHFIPSMTLSHISSFWASHITYLLNVDNIRILQGAMRMELSNKRECIVPCHACECAQ